MAGSKDNPPRRPRAQVTVRQTYPGRYAIYGPDRTIQYRSTQQVHYRFRDLLNDCDKTVAALAYVDRHGLWRLDNVIGPLPQQLVRPQQAETSQNEKHRPTGTKRANITNKHRPTLR